MAARPVLLEFLHHTLLPDYMEDLELDVAGGTLAIPLTHPIVNKTTGGAEALTLADGEPGQMLVMFLGTDGGDGTLTPATSTNFATIVFADAGDMAVLFYVNDTIGWIILALHGTAGPPAFTV